MKRAIVMHSLSYLRLKVAGLWSFTLRLEVIVKQRDVFKLCLSQALLV